MAMFSFFCPPKYSANFLIKDKNMVRDVLQEYFLKGVDRELEHIQV